MRKCQRLFNLFGMAHLQALMLGFVYSLDVISMMALGTLSKKTRTRPPGTIPQERIWAPELNFAFKYRWIPQGVGRLLIALIILRVNNKYILLVFTVMEMVVLLIGHGLYMEKGLVALQYTYLVFFFIQSARWPLAMNILSKWSTTSTFTVLMWTFKGTVEFFTPVYYVMIDELQHHGFMNMFIYLCVVVKAIFFVLWIIFGSGDPIHNVFISKEELLELRDEHRLRLRHRWKNEMPFKQMLKTTILYGIFVFHTAYMWHQSWDGSAFVSIFPKFTQTGHWLPLFLYYLRIFGSGIVAYFIDLIIKKKKATVNNVRKTCVAISAWGGGCCFLLAGANLGKEAATTAFMALNQIFHLCNFYGAIPVLHAISPNYLGFTHSIISFVAFISLGLIHEVDKILVGDGKDPTREMSFLLYFYGSFYYFSCLLMLVSGNCNRRDFDKFNTVPWKEDSIVSFP